MLQAFVRIVNINKELPIAVFCLERRCTVKEIRDKIEDRFSFLTGHRYRVSRGYNIYKELADEYVLFDQCEEECVNVSILP